MADTKSAINENVIFIAHDTPIKDAVEMMVEKQISSILVHDEADQVVGIVTERDIVRKFTLLDVKDKLDRRINTIMTRPVHLVPVEHYQEEIIRLHLAQHVRHFPIVNKNDGSKNSVIGIVSIGDFLRQFIFEKQKAEESEGPVETAKEIIHLNVLTKTDPKNDKSLQCLAKLGVAFKVYGEFVDFFKEHSKDAPPLYFDLDSYPTSVLQKILPGVKKYPGPLILATKNATLLSGFRFYLNPEYQTILLAPIDYMYCYWLLSQKWKKA